MEAQGVLPDDTNNKSEVSSTTENFKLSRAPAVALDSVVHHTPGLLHPLLERGFQELNTPFSRLEVEVACNLAPDSTSLASPIRLVRDSLSCEKHRPIGSWSLCSSQSRSPTPEPAKRETMTLTRPVDACPQCQHVWSPATVSFNVVTGQLTADCSDCGLRTVVRRALSLRLAVC